LRKVCPERRRRADSDKSRVDNPSSLGSRLWTRRRVTVWRKTEKSENRTWRLWCLPVLAEIHSVHRRDQTFLAREYEITDAIQDLLNRGRKVLGDVIKEWLADTGKRTILLQAECGVLDEWIERRVEGDVDEASSVLGRVVIPKSARVINSRLRGPVVSQARVC